MAAASAGAAVAFASLTLARHDAYQSNAYDLGFFDQIIWNTSRGHLFETTFVKYNFLGQHFDPILLAFAGLYRLGAGIDSLLLAQAIFAAAAALPLYLAATKMARSRSVGVFAAVAFLLSPPPHSAVNFDFHPETAAFFFVFLGAFFLAEGRAGLAAASVLPTLLFKEDMALVVLAFAVLTATRGNRKAAARLAAFSLAWLTIVTLVVMPLLRGGGGDLVSCYAYLIEGSSCGSFVPNLATRAASHLVRETLPGVVALLTSTAFLPLISPVSLLLSLPSMLINGLAGHDEQAHLGLHYSVPTLVLMWLGVLLTLEKLASRRILLPLAASALLSASAMGFLTSSPFAPGSKEQHLSSAHRSALAAAISHVPPGASVAAQSAVLPHLSARRKVYEFPNGRRADLVVVDPGLPWSLQSDHWGYSSRIARLPDTGYKLVFDSEGVQVCQRRQ